MGIPDFALSSHEFDLLWTDLSLGRMPDSLVVPPFGQTPDERVLLAKEIYRELSDRGLVDTARRVDTRLRALLRLLTGYRVAVDLVADIGYPVRALAATDGRAGVLATLAGGELWLTATSPAGLAAAIVDLLPAACPPIALPSQATASRASSASSARQSPAGHASGRFGFATDGGRPPPAMFTWFDTESGRYLVVADKSRSCLVPAGRADIERRITECLFPAG
ncbi:MAG: ESX secretion-associated protein EspG [Kibdelosporangium sp.]